jgi:hypothetical protein
MIIARHALVVATHLFVGCFIAIAVLFHMSRTLPAWYISVMMPNRLIDNIQDKVH